MLTDRSWIIWSILRIITELSKIVISDWQALHDLRESFSNICYVYLPISVSHQKEKTVTLTLCSQAAKRSFQGMEPLKDIQRLRLSIAKKSMWNSFPYILQSENSLCVQLNYSKWVNCHKTQAQKPRRGRKGVRPTAQALTLICWGRKYSIIHKSVRVNAKNSV